MPPRFFLPIAALTLASPIAHAAGADAVGENLLWLDSADMAEQYKQAWDAIASDEIAEPKEEPAPEKKAGK